MSNAQEIVTINPFLLTYHDPVNTPKSIGISVFSVTCFYWLEWFKNSDNRSKQTSYTWTVFNTDKPQVESFTDNFITVFKKINSFDHFDFALTLMISQEDTLSFCDSIMRYPKAYCNWPFMCNLLKSLDLPVIDRFSVTQLTVQSQPYSNTTTINLSINIYK